MTRGRTIGREPDPRQAGRRGRRKTPSGRKPAAPAASLAQRAAMAREARAARDAAPYGAKAEAVEAVAGRHGISADAMRQAMAALARLEAVTGLEPADVATLASLATMAAMLLFAWMGRDRGSALEAARAFAAGDLRWRDVAAGERRSRGDSPSIAKPRHGVYEAAWRGLAAAAARQAAGNASQGRTVLAVGPYAGEAAHLDPALGALIEADLAAAAWAARRGPVLLAAAGAAMAAEARRRLEERGVGRGEVEVVVVGIAEPALARPKGYARRDPLPPADP